MGNHACAGNGSKALKGEAHERGKLRKASLGRRADAVERVAKPCGRGFREAWPRFSDAGSKTQ
jgi:hypothetical protein